MSDKDFSSPTRVVRDGQQKQRGAVERPIMVPQRHSNIRKVFGSTQVHDIIAPKSVVVPKPTTMAQPIRKTMPVANSAQPAVKVAPPAPRPQTKQVIDYNFRAKSPVVHLEDIVESMPNKITKQSRQLQIQQKQSASATPAVVQQQLKQMTAPTKLIISASAKTPTNSTTEATQKLAIDTDAPLLHEPKKKSARGAKIFKKAQAKAEKAKKYNTEKAEKSAKEKSKKSATARMEQAVKSAALSPESATINQRVLVPASASNTATMASSMASSGSGAAVMTHGNFLTKVGSAPRITLTFKVDAAKFFAVLRALIVAVILAISGFLAWDTWMTNKSIEGVFSNPAAAMSVDSTNPATADPTSISNETWAAYTTPADQPRYIFIPSIGVKARVMSAGVTSKGGIDTPKNLNDTAWYDGSAKPNMPGQVFIDGHTSFSNTVAAAFNDLPKIEENAQITVETGNGDKINYRVVSSETVASDKVDMNKALSPREGSEKGLTLMTCTGKFDYRQQDSSHRFIVYAVQE